ncbi:MAG: glycine cleavage system protein R [Deltaproteobacteria bacterium]|nr:glycine cleavage system protein R [Deltaproteobacteria bacterium]
MAEHPRVLVITLVGADRRGIVDQVARAVAEFGGNWEESRMTRLAGTFAGILKVSVSESRADALVTALGKLGPSGLDVHVRNADAVGEVPTSATSSATSASSGRSHAGAKGGETTAPRRLRVELVGADHEGIVRDVSRVLVDSALNIEDLSTETVDAPMAGQRLFKARIDLKSAQTLDMEALRASLERLADDLVVELTLRENIE